MAFNVNKATAILKKSVLNLIIIQTLKINNKILILYRHLKTVLPLQG
jgi:hypothetical protein